MFYLYGIVTMALMLFVVTSGQSLSSGNEFLDREQQVSLSWSLQDQDSIMFEISAPTKGYLSLGFSPDGSMLESDIAVGWMINGKAFLDDRFSTAYKEPVVDKQQDYHLLSGTQNGTSMTLRFKRKLVTGDPKDRDITSGVMNLIYAFHDEAPTDGHTIAYHGASNRGSKPVTLMG